MKMIRSPTTDKRKAGNLSRLPALISVEVPGIEPGSIGGSAGLLRAYSRTNFSAPLIPGTGHRQAQPREFPSLTRSLIVRFSPLDYAAARSGASLGRQMKQGGTLLPI